MSFAVLLRGCVWAVLCGCGLFASVHAQTLLWQQLSGGGTGDPAMRPFWGPRCDRQSLLATDAQGHSVVVSSYRDRYATGGLITRYGPSGQRLWQTTYRPDGAVLHAVALLADGDVVVAGLVPRFSSLSDVLVMRLNGESGAVRWSTTLHTGSLIIGGQEVALSVGVDGDVRVAGMRWAGSNQLFVARLRGSTGQVLWDVRPSGALTLGLCDLRVDANGDVVVGELGRVEASPSLRVYRLNATDGQLQWSTASVAGEPRGMALDPSGDVFALTLPLAGQPSESQVTKWAGQTGALQWSTRLEFADPAGTRLADGLALQVTAEGDVLVGGTIVRGEPPSSLGSTPYLARLHGATGATKWSWSPLPEAHRTRSGTTSLALSPAGEVHFGTAERGDPGTWPLVQGVRVDAHSGTLLGEVQWMPTPGVNVRALGLHGSGTRGLRALVMEADPGANPSQDLQLLGFESGDTQVRFRVHEGERDDLATSPSFAPQGLGRAVSADGRIATVGCSHAGAPQLCDGWVMVTDASGQLQWQVRVRGPGVGHDELHSVSWTPQGDLLVAGRVSREDGLSGWITLRLNGQDGTERWRRIEPIPATELNIYSAYAVVLSDLHGNALLARGEPLAGDTALQAVLQQYHEADGAPGWSQVLPSASLQPLLQRSANGDPVWVVQNTDHTQVTRLDPHTGDIRWQQQVPSQGYPIALALPPDDQQALALVLLRSSGFQLARLGMATGEVRAIGQWYYLDTVRFGALALSPDGGVTVGGLVSRFITSDVYMYRVHFDPDGTSPRWQQVNRTPGASVDETAALLWTADGQLLSLRNSSQSGRKDRCRMEALHPDSGSVRWAWQLPFPAASLPMGHQTCQSLHAYGPNRVLIAARVEPAGYTRASLLNVQLPSPDQLHREGFEAAAPAR